MATGDMADTAAQMTPLDLVLTVGTSVPHLAGALAIPAWLMLAATPDRRWMMEREDSPWYPNASFASVIRVIRVPQWSGFGSNCSRSARTERADQLPPPADHRPLAYLLEYTVASIRNCTRAFAPRSLDSAR